MISKIIIAAIFVVNYGYVKSGPNPLTILLGNETNETYNFLVSVQIRESGLDDCGGSIIHPMFVITAAHCVHDHSPRDIKVKAGSPNPEGGPEGLLINILLKLEHPHYNNRTKRHDISLLRLNGSLDFEASNGTIGALGLPIDIGMTYEINTTIKAIGFGETVVDGLNTIYTHVLKEANLNIDADVVCQYAYTIILRSQICAVNEDVLLNDRDEGGPVLFKEKLFGIVSLTEQDQPGQRGYAVLVRVPDYLQFILQTIRHYR